MPKKQYLKLKPEDEEWSLRRLEKESSKLKIDNEQLLVAEFGKYYGWGGVSAILNNEIDFDTMAWLLEAGRRIASEYNYNLSYASFIGSISSKSKNPSSTFEQLTKNMTLKAKADL